jgi:hypothetical protein
MNHFALQEADFDSYPGGSEAAGISKRRAKYTPHLKQLPRNEIFRAATSATGR